MLQDGEPHLSAIFSTMTTSNTCVAIASGVFAEWAVTKTATAKAPFVASVVCLSWSFLAISSCWDENYGSVNRRASETEGLLQQEEATPALSSTSTLKTILRDRNIMVLALVSGFFEGSLFLFIFFKFPALKLSHQLSGSTDGKLFSYTTSSRPIDLTRNRTSIRPYLCHSHVLHDAWFSPVQTLLHIYEPTIRAKDVYRHSHCFFYLFLYPWPTPRRAPHTVVFLHLRALLWNLLSRHGVAEEQAD